MVWPSPINVEPLQGLTNLHDLTITGLGFTAITAIEHVEAIGEILSLDKLTLGSLLILDLSFLRKLQNLRELSLHQLPVQSIEPLRNLKSLQNLSMVEINVVDISPLLELPKLGTFRYIRVPARTDVLTELARRGVKVDPR